MISVNNQSKQILPSFTTHFTHAFYYPFIHSSGFRIFSDILFSLPSLLLLPLFHNRYIHFIHWSLFFYPNFKLQKFFLWKLIPLSLFYLFLKIFHSNNTKFHSRPFAPLPYFFFFLFLFLLSLTSFTFLFFSCWLFLTIVNFTLHSSFYTDSTFSSISLF